MDLDKRLVNIDFQDRFVGKRTKCRHSRNDRIALF